MVNWVTDFAARHAKLIAAIVGLVVVYLSPEDAKWVTSILTAAGVYTVPNK